MSTPTRKPFKNTVDNATSTKTNGHEQTCVGIGRKSNCYRKASSTCHGHLCTTCCKLKNVRLCSGHTITATATRRTNTRTTTYPYVNIFQ